MHSSSKTTCSATTSDTQRGSFIAGSGRTGGQQAHQPLRAVHTPNRPAGHGLTRPTGAPQIEATKGTPGRAGAEPRLDFGEVRVEVPGMGRAAERPLGVED